MRWIALFLAALPALGALPTPEGHFGHPMGADRKLVRWSDVLAYFRSLDAASESVRVTELGRTTEGRQLIVAAIASPETIRDLERYREITNRLADPRSTPAAEAAALVARGKPVVLITCSIHSTEVASTMTAAQFAYDLLAKDTQRHRTILRDTILLLVPSLNPDGVDKVRDWYERWLGGPYEGAPMTELYHKYAGHDINRDWYVFSQKETRLVVEKLHNAWRPQVVYDVHQMGRHGARIFVPPWIDPVDPNIDPLIAQQVNAFGTAMAVDLTAAGRKGVLIHGIYDYFSPSRHYQSYHGALRLLSESASVRYATPVTVEAADLEPAGRNYSARERSWNFLEPWEGGEWRLADVVADQLVAFESVLYSAALRRRDLLENFYRIGERVIERGRGLAWVVRRDQHDPNAVTRLLQVLRTGDVEIRRALEAADLAGGTVREGDYLIPLAQPYGSFAKTLLEKQDYPDRRLYPGGPPQRPYDVTAHTLPLLMGVDAFEVRGASGVASEAVDPVQARPGRVAAASELSLSPAYGSSWKAVNRLLRAGIAVHRRARDGRFLLRADAGQRTRLQAIASELGLDFEASGEAASDHRPLRQPRVAVYAGHVPNMDEGWTRWVLERNEFPYESAGNDRVLGGLSGYDALILPDASPEVIEQGYSHEYGQGESIVPPAYREGLGPRGPAALKAFLAGGGTILAFNRAAAYLAQALALPVENVVEGFGDERFFGPGTLVRVEADLSHPLCFGMRAEGAVWFESGPVFRIRRQPSARARQPLHYPASKVLASGWLLGEGYLAGRPAVVDQPVGRGRVFLFGFRPQYRAQSSAMFKMVFNGLFL